MNEISQEERGQIIAKMMEYLPKENSFTYTRIAKAIDADCANDKECWQRLIDLIESAPVKKNIKAAEFADKLEKAFDNAGSFFDAVAECLGYDGLKTSSSEDKKRLCDAIRNLGAPDDGMQWPLDKDGVEIKPGDTVYYSPEGCHIRSKEFIVCGFKFRFGDAKDVLVQCYSEARADDSFYYSPSLLSHNKGRTLDQIKVDVCKIVYGGSMGEATKLIDEAYEMGKKAVKEEQ